MFPRPCTGKPRHLTQLRDALVSEVMAMKQRIKSLLLMEGLEVPLASPRQPVVRSSSKPS